MSLTLGQLGIWELSTTDRLELIGLLRDSITDAGPAQPIPDWHRAEIERRLDAAQRDPSTAIPYADVRKKLSQSR